MVRTSSRSSEREPALETTQPALIKLRISSLSKLRARGTFIKVLQAVSTCALTACAVLVQSRHRFPMHFSMQLERQHTGDAWLVKMEWWQTEIYWQCNCLDICIVDHIGKFACLLAHIFCDTFKVIQMQAQLVCLSSNKFQMLSNCVSSTWCFLVLSS